MLYFLIVLYNHLIVSGRISLNFHHGFVVLLLFDEILVNLFDVPGIFNDSEHFDSQLLGSDTIMHANGVKYLFKSAFRVFLEHKNELIHIADDDLVVFLEFLRFGKRNSDGSGRKLDDIVLLPLHRLRSRKGNNALDKSILLVFQQRVTGNFMHDFPRDKMGNDLQSLKGVIG